MTSSDLPVHQGNWVQYVKSNKLHEADVTKTDCFKGRVCCSWLGKLIWPKRYEIGKEILEAIEKIHDEENPPHKCQDTQN
jgi:hypothetical protein